MCLKGSEWATHSELTAPHDDFILAAVLSFGRLESAGDGLLFCSKVGIAVAFAMISRKLKNMNEMEFEMSVAVQFFFFLAAPCCYTLSQFHWLLFFTLLLLVRTVFCELVELKFGPQKFIY